MTDKPVKLEDHHPDMMRYSPETRRIVNAYNGHGQAAGRGRAGWDAVDAELRDILDQIMTDAFSRGVHAAQ